MEKIIERMKRHGLPKSMADSVRTGKQCYEMVFLNV